MGVFFLVACGTAQLHAQNPQPSCKITATADRPQALYKVGEKAVFTVAMEGSIEKEKEIKVIYTMLEDGLKSKADGAQTFSPGKTSFTVEYEWRKPSFVLVKITSPALGGNQLLAGAACEPEKIEPSMPKPGDFDDYWNGQKAIMEAMPFHETLTPEPSLTNETIETYAITLDNINGSKIRGYFSKPKGAGPFPAFMNVNAAGIYSVSPNGVAAYARRGAMAIDINPHDIENGKPQEYYKDLGEGKLKGWQLLGREDRKTSYFLRMFCSCHQAARYLTGRPEWNKKQFVVSGSSMGGGQAFVTASLCPKVTAFAANVPALCDHSGPLAERSAGWPKWVIYADGTPAERQLEASQYYDAVNFARSIRAKALVSAGFIDTTCAPSSVYAAFNALPGEKRLFNMPKAGHEVPADWAKERDSFITAELGLK